MSTPVAHGRTKSPGGGEMQTATPRILATEPGQRQRMEPGKAERGEEQRKAEEARTTVQAERSDGGTLEDEDWVRTDTPERLGLRSEADEPADDDWEDWIAEQQRQADAALVSAVRTLALQRTTSNSPIHDVSGRTAPRESRASAIRGPERESIEDEWREWNERVAEEQRRALAGDVLWREKGEISGGESSEMRKGGPRWKLEEDLLNRLDGGRDWRRRPRSDWPPKQARRGARPNGRVFFSATDDPELKETERWQPGRCIAEPDWGRVRDRPNTRVFRRGDTVAVTEVGNPGLHPSSWRLPESSITRYFVATVLEVDAKQCYPWNPDCNGLLLDEGAGYHVHREYSWVREITREDGTTWELDPSAMEGDTTPTTEQGAAKEWLATGEVYTQGSRRPGEVIGPGDMIHIRSHRPRTSMHWERSLVAVPFIGETGQQGFRYAKICVKDAATEASSKGLYQLDGGPHNPKMLRARGSFYAIDRHSPPRASLSKEDIQEVPGRNGARMQEEWTVLAQDQGTEPWNKPVNADL